MMDETEIDRVCRQDPYINRYYIGTFAVDEVPRQLMPNTTFVVNLNRRQDSSMGHWVIGSSLPFSPSTQLERSFFYFDSFAKPPPKKRFRACLLKTFIITISSYKIPFLCRVGLSQPTF